MTSSRSPEYSVEGNFEPSTVFLVEDESLVAEDLKVLLEKQGFNVVAKAQRGRKALDFIRNHSPDLVLVDIQLDGKMDGIEVAKKIAIQPPPVVFLTAHTDQSTLDRAKEADPLGYLTKPINEADLRTTLEVAIERKATLEELKRAKKGYQTLVEANPDIVLRVNQNTTITFASNNVSKIGYEPEELVGTGLDELIHPDDLKESDDSNDCLQNNGTEKSTEILNLHNEQPTENQTNRQFEVRVRPGDSEINKSQKYDYPIFEVNSSALYDHSADNKEGQFLGSILVMRNISLRKEAQEELELKERAMASASEGITIARAEGKDQPLTYVNEGFVNMTGYEPDEVLGEDCRLLQGEQTKQETRSKIRKAIQNDEIISTEILNYRKSGEKFWNELSITPVRNKEGEVTHYIGVQKDVTERKAREKELRQSEKLAAIGEMAAGLMHEINNPNAFIRTNINFLKRAWNYLEETFDFSGDDFLEIIAEEMGDTIDAMFKGTKRIENIVDKVKLFARRETSRENHELFNPVPVVERALKMVKHELFNEALTFKNKIDSEADLLIKSDLTEFKQVIVNLTENALDAIESTDDPEVKIILENSDSQFRVEVSDNGEGITEDDQSKIFDPFYTTKNTGDGTGLGLSIVKGIIERSNGNIEVDSKSGKGTKFTVEFPLQGG